MATPNFQFLADDGESLGQVRLEEQQLLVKFKDLFVPFSSSSGRVGVNAKGKVRIITLQGATSASDFSGATNDLQLRDFVDTIEAWMNNEGVQVLKDYTDSLGRTKQVNCIDFTWRRSLADPFRILYTFLLKEG